MMTRNPYRGIGRSLAAALLVLHWVCVPALAWAGTASDTRNLYEHIQKTIAESINQTAGGATTIGIIANGDLVSVASYGPSELGGNVHVTADTIYPIASITKVVTGIMFLQLVERHVVHLSDPVVKYVPELEHIPNPFPWSPPVTLLQLATMTSGINDGDWPGLHEFPSKDGSEDTWDKRLQAVLGRTRYAYEPGTRREYSSEGYIILGLALSRAARQPFTQYVQREIFEPLGMRDSSFGIDPKTAARFAYANPQNTSRWCARLFHSCILPAAVELECRLGRCTDCSTLDSVRRVARGDDGVMRADLQPWLRRYSPSIRINAIRQWRFDRLAQA